MLTFKQYLQETIRFWSSADDDFLHYMNRIILFQPIDILEYVKQGKTLDLEGHAVKHIQEVDNDIGKTVLNNVRTILKNYDEPLYYFPYGKAGSIEETQVRVIRDKADLDNIPNSAFINLMDFIHDKKCLGGSLTEMEQKIYKEIRIVTKAYEQVATEVLENGAKNNLDEVKDLPEAMSKRYMSFTVYDRSALFQIYLDMARNLILITLKGKARTLFRPSRNPKERLRPFEDKMTFFFTLFSRYGRRWRFKNSQIPVEMGWPE